MSMVKTVEKADELKEMIDSEFFDQQFENMTTLKLSDAIRMGSKNTTQAEGWGSGESMCALHAGVSAAIALGFIDMS